MGVVGEILVVTVKVGAQTVVVVQHGGDAVKAEAVKVVFGHPVLQVAQQEVDDARLAVVEALGSPGGMVALGAVVEELPGGAVEHVDALGGVLHGVGVDHVQQHTNAHFVGLIHQVFQVLGLAEPGGGGEEVGDLVAEGAVVGMLHNGHELDGVVARLLDSGQGVVGELAVGAHLTLLLGHTHVGLVDVQLVLAYEILVRPREDLPVVDDLAGKGQGLGVLDHPVGVQGDMLGAGHIGVHNSFDLAALPQSVVALQEDFPVAVSDVGQGMAGLVPAVEVTLQVQLVGAGRPLPVDPAALHMVEAEVVMGVGELVQGLPLGKDPALGCPVQEHAQINVPRKRLQLGIQF